MDSTLPLRHLVHASSDDFPAGGVVQIVVAADKRKLRAAFWPALSRQPKGTVCLFHGRSEFIEKYGEVIRDLRSRGFCVATFDWRGQGGSERLLGDHRRGHVRHFDDYQLDVEAFMRGVVFPDCPPPYFALAHSMGAAILFSMLSARPLWFERLVAAGPMIGLPDVTVFSRVLVTVLTAVGLSTTVTPGFGLNAVALKPFAGNPVTSDPRRYAFAAQAVRREPALGLGGPTLGWVEAAFQVMDKLASPDFGLAWRTPTLLVAAGVDRVVSTEAALAFAARLRATKAVVIPGAQHELMMERDDIRERFFAAFDAFIPGSPD